MLVVKQKTFGYNKKCIVFLEKNTKHFDNNEMFIVFLTKNYFGNNENLSVITKRFW